MCYDEHMDTTIRNLDPIAYRELKAKAALVGKTIGELVNEATRERREAAGARERRAA